MRLFTVEQCELIRRLRLTGISAEGVLEAFAALESIEANFETIRLQNATIAAMMCGDLNMKIPFIADIQMENLVRNPALLQHLTSQTSAAGTQIMSSLSSLNYNSNNENLKNENIKGVEEFNMLPPLSTQSNGARPIRSTRTPISEITTLDDPQELDEFISMGEEKCIADMRQFITNLSLRQTTVAQLTQVSQPYISKMLNGNHRELSLRCRKNIYSWYLNMRRHPEKLSTYLADPLIKLETNADGDLLPQRRERYVFRPILIKILEKFFVEAPFPDFNKRSEIAGVCNKSLLHEKGHSDLLPKEVVSPQVVANWFANKRKEMRRKTNEDSKNIEYCGNSPESYGTSTSKSSSDDSRPNSEGNTSTLSSDLLDMVSLLSQKNSILTASSNPTPIPL